MKIKTIIVLTFMPVLAFSQSDFYNKNYGNNDASIAIGLEKQLISRLSNHSEHAIETTLINDTRYPKPEAILFLDKSYDLSLTTKNEKSVRFLKDQNLNKMLFEVKPFIDYKLQFEKPIDLKNLPEN